MSVMYGAIEAGGTKFICATCDEQMNIKEKLTISTTTPEKTMKEVFRFFDKHAVTSIGVGSFGPIDINTKSPTYGYITNTPKSAWKNYNLLGELKKHYRIPITWTTDVNAAAYGELKMGAAIGTESCIYITVGTGIGGGVVVNGSILKGFSHPEIGHILVKRHKDDKYEGNCPFHGDCLEGMASGPAIEGRTGVKGQFIHKDSDIWEFEAYYLAQAIVNYTLVISPEKIILGGGVMKQKHLFPMIRESFKEQLSNYVTTPDLNEYIVPCALDGNAAIIGCFLSAKEYANNL